MKLQVNKRKVKKKSVRLVMMYLQLWLSEAGVCGGGIISTLMVGTEQMFILLKFNAYLSLQVSTLCCSETSPQL